MLPVMVAFAFWDNFLRRQLRRPRFLEHPPALAVCPLPMRAFHLDPPLTWLKRRRTWSREGFAPAQHLRANNQGRRHCLEQSLSKPRCSLALVRGRCADG